MTSFNLIDPELRDFFLAFPKIDFNAAPVAAVRAMERSMFAPAPDLPKSVRREEVIVPGLNGGPDVRCVTFAPKEPAKNRPGYVHIHGGGLVLGFADSCDARNARLCAQLDAVIFSVDYRLAPEHPYPAGLHDCYAALVYMHNKATPLGVDPQRIAVGGESAGGCLAASLAIYAQQQKASGAAPTSICHQHLMFPMLDDRTGQNGLPDDPTVGEFCWTRENNVFCWKAYLADRAPQDVIIPAREEALVGLPPAWIGVGNMDLFLDENILYARRLMAAGIAVEFQTYPGAPHAFYGDPTATVSKRFERDYTEALGRGLGTE